MPNYNPPQNKFNNDAALAREAARFFPITVVAARASQGTVQTVGNGLLLRLATPRPAYRLWGTCPGCGGRCWSERFDSHAGFATQLAEFKPSEHHRLGCVAIRHTYHRSFGRRRAAGHHHRVNLTK